MALTNKWTNPFRRSFQDIKNDMLDALMTIKDNSGKPLITDKSEGNIFVIIISLFAAIAEALHYYIDNMARECFLTTARRYSSVTQQGLLVDYHAHGANAATVDVILTRELIGKESGAELQIPKGTEFLDSKGNKWLSAWDVVWGKNSTSVTVPLIQHEVYNSSSVNNSTITSPGQSIPLDNAGLGGKYIEHNSVSLDLGGVKWTQVDTFAYSKPTDTHYMVVVDDSDIPTIVFGDGKFGKQPTVGVTIKVQFYITAGEMGNVYENSITRAPSIVTSAIPKVTCNNPYASGDGLNYEDIELLRKHIPIHARTMALAVTKKDFVDCAKLVPGVKDCAVDYICGRKIDLYISPISSTVNNGIASSTLISKVKDYLEKHAPLTTWLNVFSAGIANINLGIEVTGKPSFHETEIQNSIIRALYDAYSYEKAQIGGKVRISDIYALIDNLPEVDFLHIKKFFVSPWPKLIYGNKQLDMTVTNILKAKGRMSYIISFILDNQFSIYSVENRFELENQTVEGTVTVDDTINGFNFSLIVRGTYAKGSKYQITISEPNMDYEEPGYNQVVFDHNKLTLNIHETV